MKLLLERGIVWHRGGILASHTAAPGSILGVPDVAEAYWRGWLEESGQRLENIDRTYLVLASGKLAIQKTLFWAKGCSHLYYRNFKIKFSPKDFECRFFPQLSVPNPGRLVERCQRFLCSMLRAQGFTHVHVLFDLVCLIDVQNVLMSNRS